MYVEVAAPAEAAVARLAEAGVRVLAVAADRVRVVFHRDIGDETLASAVDAFKRLL